MEELTLEKISPRGKIGLLTTEQRQFVAERILEKCRAGEGKQGITTCPMCRTDAEWVVGQHVVTPIVFDAGGLQLAGAVYPYISLSCTNCGNTHFFNALNIGLLKHRPDGTLALYDQIEGGKSGQ